MRILALTALLLFVPTLADAPHSDKDSIIFLLDKACALRDSYTMRFADSWVVCVNERMWILAQIQLYGFEKYYHVVYVTQDNQHPEAEAGVYGEAFFRNGKNYAYSVNNPTVIQHELLHLRCACHFTPDGEHDGERGTLSWLWEREQSKSELYIHLPSLHH